MKKRIISLFLAFAVFVGVFSIPKRAHAIPAIIAEGWTLVIVAFELLDLMIKGEEPGVVQAIRSGIALVQETAENSADSVEHFFEVVSDPDNPYHQTYSSFWDDYGNSIEGIFEELKTMYENGEITISNGRVDLTYDQFYELFDVAYSFVDSFGVDFDTSYSYFAFDYSPGVYLRCDILPQNDMFYLSNEGESYCLMYYDDNRLIFSGIYFIWKPDSIKGYYNFFAYTLSSNFDKSIVNSSGFNEAELESEYSRPYVSYLSISSLDLKHRFNLNSNYQYCFVFDNGNLTYTPVSAVDISGCKTAIVSTIGNLGDFLKSIQSVKFVDTVSDNLDDLSTVLPVEESPVLSIPLNPDLSVSIPDQITVSTPTSADVPLSDYLNPVITDIDTPPIILEKFPFCIPFDFIRIIGVLAADPVAPVFHIPISTHPKNLEQFAGNETIGDYVSPDNPLFEIDEEIVIDLSHIPLIQPICYTIFIVGFVILLIKLTPKLIQH